jgi:hypothetical protein
LLPASLEEIKIWRIFVVFFQLVALEKSLQKRRCNFFVRHENFSRSGNEKMGVARADYRAEKRGGCGQHWGWILWFIRGLKITNEIESTKNANDKM